MDLGPFQGGDPAFFSTDDGEWFVANDSARGPWNPEACHGGPPSALMARAVERKLTQHRLTRLTVDLTRPIPVAGFSVTAEVMRTGRKVATSRATIVDGEGRTCATGHAMHLATDDIGPVPTADVDAPDVDCMGPGEFPVGRVNHDLAGFTTSAIDVGYPPGHTRAPGPTTLWMRTIPIVAGESPSPFQKICPLADCGNATSRNAEPWEITFMNVDLTIVLQRDPVGHWMASSAVSYWEPTGVGLAGAVLYDTEGPVGRASQTLLLRPA